MWGCYNGFFVAGSVTLLVCISLQFYYTLNKEVLVSEINNSDSRKYAILTTTDSFYRYKEAVKELISQILNANDRKSVELEKEGAVLELDSISKKRNEYNKNYCDKASQLVVQVEQEFDLIERKYNKLIEQKSIFAQRALARIHYTLQVGANEEDNILKLIGLLDRSEQKENILEELRGKIEFTTQYRNITDSSFYNRKERGDYEFRPMAVKDTTIPKEQNMLDYIPKPLYTKKQLQAFRQKNMQNGRFVTTEQTVENVEDLQKLLFIWQEATQSHLEENKVSLGEERTTEQGLTFTQLFIDE